MSTRFRVSSGDTLHFSFWRIQNGAGAEVGYGEKCVRHQRASNGVCRALNAPRKGNIGHPASASENLAGCRKLPVEKKMIDMSTNDEFVGYVGIVYTKAETDFSMSMKRKWHISLTRTDSSSVTCFSFYRSTGRILAMFGFIFAIGLVACALLAGRGLERLHKWNELNSEKRELATRMKDMLAELDQAENRLALMNDWEDRVREEEHLARHRRQSAQGRYWWRAAGGPHL
jgi:hypothetical protein